MTRTRFGDVGADLWRISFLRILRRHVRSLQLDRGVVRKTAISARSIYEQNVAQSPDKRGPMVIAINALILAAYRELINAGIERVTAYDVVRDSFRANFSRTTRLGMRIAMRLSRDPVDSVSRVGLARVFRWIFGSSFTFRDHVEDSHVELVITKCAGHDFFVREGEPLLTRILCGWDHNWLGPIQSSRHDVKVSRPITLATGAAHCEFRIERGQGQSSIADVTIQRRSDVVTGLGGPASS